MNDRELIKAAAKAAGLELARWDDSREGAEMSTDRELLEDAAKAAQLRVVLWHGNVPNVTTDDMVSWPWNPLTDDGDALRLAVAVNLLVMPYPLDKAVRVVASTTHENTIVSWGTPPDPCAATRRAIVMAAALLPPTREFEKAPRCKFTV